MEVIHVKIAMIISPWRKILLVGTLGLMKSWGEEWSRLHIEMEQVNVEHVSPKQRERLTSEACSLKSLKDKNIIKFYDFWINDEKKTLDMITEIFVSGSLRRHFYAAPYWFISGVKPASFDKSPEDAAYIAELIDALVMKLVPGWKTSRGNIASAPERHHCLQSLKDQEALQSINSEISAEQDVTISSCASTNKPLDLPIAIFN
ncbi:hypothetical protein SADUNF_Sadunf10G0174700 [Salix dunnii]|uniref:non-specific serine/threonine protein kinase n=1 Tax=Salix dunnii TaxID=1413687 RepID=A0A835JPA8_9ROSI|nr:hypothetical protein SADUNF_Sadunf10G0174700 [Salix dunnii]